MIENDNKIQALFELVKEKSKLVSKAQDAKTIIEEELQLAKLQLEEINTLSMSLIEGEVLEEH